MSTAVALLHEAAAAALTLCFSPGGAGLLAAEEADPVESAIPEQFVSRYRGGRWVTEAVSHSGG